MNRRQNQMCNNITRQQQCRANHMAAKSPMTGGRMRAGEDPAVAKNVIFDTTTNLCRVLDPKIDSGKVGAYATIEDCNVAAITLMYDATIDYDCSCMNSDGAKVTSPLPLGYYAGVEKCQKDQPQGCNTVKSTAKETCPAFYDMATTRIVNTDKALAASAKALDASNKQVISSNKALADSKAKEGCSKDEQKKLKMWYWVIIGIAGFLLIGLALLFWHFNKKLKDEIKLYKPQPPSSPATSLASI